MCLQYLPARREKKKKKKKRTRTWIKRTFCCSLQQHISSDGLDWIKSFNVVDLAAHTQKRRTNFTGSNQSVIHRRSKSLFFFFFSFLRVFHCDNSSAVSPLTWTQSWERDYIHSLHCPSASFEGMATNGANIPINWATKKKKKKKKEKNVTKLHT